MYFWLFCNKTFRIRPMVLHTKRTTSIQESFLFCAWKCKMRWPCTAPVAWLGQEKKENRNQFRFNLSFTLFTFIFFSFFFVFVVVLLSSFYGFQWHVQHHVVALARVYWYCQKRPNRNAEKDAAAATTRRMENRNQTEANAVNRI